MQIHPWLRSSPLLLLSLSLAAGCASPGGEAETIEIARGAVTSGAVKINCGGSAVAPGWIADDDYSGTTSTIGTRTNSLMVDPLVVNPAPDVVYETGRFSLGTMTYTLPGFSTSSTNLIRLHFAETHWTAKGQRSFDVTINGTKVLSAFDLVAAAGAANARIIREFTMPPDDQGRYVITFTTIKDAAMINGIEVAPASVASVQRIRAGGIGLGAFAADQGYTGTTSTVTRTHTINLGKALHLAPVALYQSQRYGDDFTYTVTGLRASSPNVVRLHFCDTHFTATGQRKFNVAIQGANVLPSFDLVAAGGFDTAVVREFKATADANGKIAIRFTSVLDKATISGIEVLQTVPWAMRRDMTSGQYQVESDLRLAQGYRTTYVDGYTVGSTTKFVAIWELGTQGLVTMHDMTAAQVQQQLVDRKNQGLQLTLLNGYAAGTTERYVAIWENRAAPLASFVRIGMTSAEYQTESNTQTAAGLRQVHVSGYTINGQERYAAQFEKRASTPLWAARHGMNLATLQSEMATHLANGDRLTDISGFWVGSTDLYTAIWEHATGLPQSSQVRVSAAQFPLEWDDLYHQGFQPRAVVPFAPSSGAESYMGIWDNTQWSATDLASIEAAGTAIRKDGGAAVVVPSTSIAFSKDGRLVFSKAFGSATQAVGSTPAVPAHVASLYRIGSISKPIASTAINTLIERGLVSLNSTVFGTGSLTGTTYGTQPYKAMIPYITVGELLSHTSGWIRDIPGIAGQTPRYAVDYGVNNYPAGAIPNGQWGYSNGGYLALARVLETVTNQPFNTYSYGTWVRNNVLIPMGIPTMEIGASAKTAAKLNEVTYYTGNAGVDPYVDAMPEMDGNGGWIASASDLVQFALRVDGSPTVPDVLSPQTTKLMQQKCGVANAGYGLGWFTDGAGNVQHNGVLAGATGQLRIVPSGVVYSALVNWQSNLSVLDGSMFNLVTTNNGGSGALAYPWIDLSPAYNTF